MEDNLPHPEDLDSATIHEEAGELRVPHELDESEAEARRVEKWQFRKSWEKFFGDIASTEEVKPQTPALPGPDSRESSVPAADNSLRWSAESIDQTQPAEKLYELRQEVKDAPNPVRGASSVGKVMTDALSQRQANVVPQLAATEGLHRTLQKQSIVQSGRSLYKQAIVYGLISAVFVLLILLANSVL